MKRKSLIFLTVVFFIIASCTKEYDLKMNQDIQVTVQGYVFDKNTSSPIANATVEWPSGSAVTDTSGFFKVEGIAPGSMTFTFSAANYASVIETGVFNLENFNGNKFIKSFVVKLPKKDKTLQTNVFEIIGKMYKPVSNVPYKIDLGEGFMDRIITGVTSAEGKIVHQNLPDTYLKLTIDFEKDGKRYHLYGNSAQALPSEFPANIYIEENTASSFLRILSSNILNEEGDENTDFQKGDNITFKFSASIDLEYQYQCTLYKNSSNLVASDITWSEENTVLTINPIGDSLEVGAEYRVGLNLRSKAGDFLNDNSYNQYYYFSVENGSSTQAFGKVGQLTLTYPTDVTNYTSSIQISFDEVENATYYEVYGQYKNGDYMYLTGIYDYSVDGTVESSSIYLENLPGIQVPSTGLFSNGAEYRIIVRAGNSSSSIYGMFSDPLVLKN